MARKPQIRRRAGRSIGAERTGMRIVPRLNFSSTGFLRAARVGQSPTAERRARRCSAGAVQRIQLFMYRRYVEDCAEDAPMTCELETMFTRIIRSCMRQVADIDVTIPCAARIRHGWRRLLSAFWRCLTYKIRQRMRSDSGCQWSHPRHTLTRCRARHECVQGLISSSP